MQTNEVLGMDGQHIGKYERSVQAKEGKLILVSRDERLGGGTIVLSVHEAGEPYPPWHLPYREVSIREAPPYSTNVPLEAYFRYWERLGANNNYVSMAAYVPTGSGKLQSNGGVPDYLIAEAITDGLHDDTSGHIIFDLINLSVHEGTVLLEGYQNDTDGRLATAEVAASVPGVMEIINMLVICPL